MGIDGTPISMTAAGGLLIDVAADPMTVYDIPVNPLTGAALAAPARVMSRVPNSFLPQYSKDGRHMAYLSSAGGGAWQQIVRSPLPILSIQSLETSHTLSFPLKLRQVMSYDWSPDGRTFLARGTDLRGGYGLHLIDVASGDVTPLAIGTPDEVRYGHPQWTGEGRRLYYTRGQPGVISGPPIMERDLDTDQERVFLDWSEVRTADGSPFRPREFVVSPDRRRVAGWTGSGFANGTLWIVSLDTKSVVELLRVNGNPNPIVGRALSWTADSRALLVNRPEGPGPDARRSLWLIPIDGSAPVELAIDLPIQNLQPAMHPDGRRIAFVSGGANTREIRLLENFLPPRPGGGVSTGVRR
jgi:Tol biopolymer transport system component